MRPTGFVAAILLAGGARVAWQLGQNPLGRQFFQFAALGGVLLYHFAPFCIAGLVGLSCHFRWPPSQTACRIFLVERGCGLARER